MNSFKGNTSLETTKISRRNQKPRTEEELTSFDILLGKEKSIFNHRGNIRFRAIINTKLDQYKKAPNKSSKSRLIRQVHADLNRSGYRFLQQDNVTGLWKEVGYDKARDKVSHALRDRAREQKKATMNVESSARLQVRSHLMENASRESFKPIEVDLRNLTSTRTKRRDSILAIASAGSEDGLCPARRLSLFSNLNFNDTLSSEKTTIVGLSKPVDTSQTQRVANAIRRLSTTSSSNRVPRRLSALSFVKDLFPFPTYGKRSSLSHNFQDFDATLNFCYGRDDAITHDSTGEDFDAFHSLPIHFVMDESCMPHF